MPPAPPELSDNYCFTETDGVITATVNDIPGYRVVKTLGTIYGLTVRSRNIAAGLGMITKSMAGGELKWFTNMVCNDCQTAHGTACVVEKIDDADGSKATSSRAPC